MQWSDLPVELKNELELRRYQLQYRYKLKVPVRFSSSSTKFGIVPMYDKKGTVKNFAAKSAVKRTLEQMGVNTDQFLKSRPTLHKLEWGGNEIPCGGIVEDHFAPIMESIRKATTRGPVTVNVTFIASAVEMEQIPINKDLECKLNFISCCGAVFTQIPDSSPLQYTREKKRPKLEDEPPTEQLPFALTVGTRIRKVNHAVIDADNPLESFVSNFENRMYSLGDQPQDTFSLTVQIPLHVDENPPCIVALFSKALLKAAKIIKSSNTVEQDKIITDNKGYVPYPTLLSMQSQSISNDDLLLLLNDKFVLEWALSSMGKGIHSYSNTGTLGGTIEPSEEATDTLLEYVHASNGLRRKKLQGPKLQNLKSNVMKEYNVVGEYYKQPGKTGNLYLAKYCSELLLVGNCPVCKKDMNTGSHHHEDEVLLYGNIYRIDMSKYSPITLFLDKLGWRSWSHVDFIFPIEMLPERIDYAKSTGMDIRFRAVVTRAQLQFFEQVYQTELVATLQRHFNWDLTGSVIRSEWSWEAETRKKRAAAEVIDG
eukprot:TRINITY_DN588_c10_g1_i1.p1 TRINITY_DN588_c10_g1~~TRINITY_DN588_c10_g1_i1.p1  ORF type:complete len:539 (+),score=109.81 TRINITY_DN588_c10_g1_i1:52-1668(+)